MNEAKTKLPTGHGFTEARGSAAAPKIIHAFKLDLTKKQAKQLREVWRDHAADHGLIIMQPIISWGPFTVMNAWAQCAVLNKECAKMIHETIEQARQPNEKAQ